jgi:hypothetical protein
MPVRCSRRWLLSSSYSTIVELVEHYSEPPPPKALSCFGYSAFVALVEQYSKTSHHQRHHRLLSYSAFVASSSITPDHQ